MLYAVSYDNLEGLFCITYKNRRSFLCGGVLYGFAFFSRRLRHLRIRFRSFGLVRISLITTARTRSSRAKAA